MKFTSKKKGVIQYYKGKVIARFKNYQYETDDSSKIKALKELGYSYEQDLSELKRTELFELCREYDIPNYSRMKNTEIIKSLKEVIQ